jgi:WhiB family redox-sensing transcriptional regulator
LHGWGPRADWEQLAACIGAPLEWFFGNRDDGRSKHATRRTKEQETAAKALCDTCPVLTSCREWAVTSGIPWGLVGGMTETERQRERVRRGLPVSNTKPRNRDPEPKSRSGVVRSGTVRHTLPGNGF